jgi:hypothetical protein
MDFPVSLINDPEIGDSTCIKILAQATKGYMCIPLNQFHGKDRGIRLMLTDEVLEDRKGIVRAQALESHSHDTIFWGSVGFVPFQRSAESLLGGSEIGNGDIISV